jgi:MHS family proline/betaine transporter-like MFS transporter
MPRHLKKIVISCFAGNMLEWYEFAVFGFLTTYISQNFFPGSSPYLATLMTYAIFATGFIMRPLGAILSGHIGDRQGRRGGLLLSITLMALPTFIIGCLPTYNQIGILAPILLLLCRMIQGISLGGEFSGSIVYLIEHSPKEKSGFYASWADLGSSVGMIAASLTSLVLTLYFSQDQMLSFGWRLPFLAGIAFGILGYYLRRNLTETPEFKPTTEKKAWGALVSDIFKISPRRFISCSTFLAINSGGYYFLVIYLPKQILVDALPSYAMTLLPLISIIAMVPSTFMTAYWSDKIGQIPILIVGYLSSLALAYPALLFTTTSTKLWPIIIVHVLFSWSLGACFGPRSSLMARMFPTSHRYTGVSITYNIANATFGGLSPIICATIANSFGPSSPALWIIACALVSFFSVLQLTKTSKASEISSTI